MRLFLLSRGERLCLFPKPHHVSHVYHLIQSHGSRDISRYSTFFQFLAFAHTIFFAFSLVKSSFFKAQLRKYMIPNPFLALLGSIGHSFLFFCLGSLNFMSVFILLVKYLNFCLYSVDSGKSLEARGCHLIHFCIPYNFYLDDCGMHIV